MVNSYSVVFRNSPNSYSVVFRFGIVLFRNSPISYSVVVRSGICRSVPPPLGHNGICQNGKKSPFYTFDSSQNVQKGSQKCFCRFGICRFGQEGGATERHIYAVVAYAVSVTFKRDKTVHMPFCPTPICRSGFLPFWGSTIETPWSPKIFKNI